MKNKLSDKKGVVLVFILAVVLAMSTMVLFFQRRIFSHLESSGVFLENKRVRYIAEAGVEIGKEIIKLQNAHDRRFSSVLENGFFWPVEKEYEIGDYILNLVIDDESAKINPNRIFRNQEGGIDRKLYLILENFFIIMGYADSNILRDSLMDWMDEDDIPRQDGAEAVYYRTAGYPYVPPNRPLIVLEEIMLIRGFTEELFYGEDEDGEEKKGLIDFITIFSDGKINVNSCRPEVLNALGFTAANVESIIAERERRPLNETIMDGINSSVFQENKDYISFTGSYYSIRSSVIKDGVTEKSLRIFIRTGEDGKEQLLRWDLL